jgi:hypothetical protein
MGDPDLTHNWIPLSLAPSFLLLSHFGGKKGGGGCLRRCSRYLKLGIKINAHKKNCFPFPCQNIVSPRSKKSVRNEPENTVAQTLSERKGDIV